MPTPEIATTYLEAQRRIDALVRPLDATDLDRPVPACPGWTVHDTVSHLAGNVAWAADGRLRGLPSDEDTAGQVAELAGVPTADVLDRWAEGAPGFAELAAAADLWPAAIDVVTHEHDIRHAVGRPGEREGAPVRDLAELLLGWWQPSRPIEVVTGDQTWRCGPADGDPLRWTTTPFEVLRARMGRRSRAQLAAMAWSDDPGDVLDDLTVFAPADEDIDE
jgi:uncharacterized protein (TIGR03083 family)